MCDEPQQAEGWKEKIMLKVLYHPTTSSEYNY